MTPLDGCRHNPHASLFLMHSVLPPEEIKEFYSKLVEHVLTLGAREEMSHLCKV